MYMIIKAWNKYLRYIYYLFWITTTLLTQSGAKSNIFLIWVCAVSAHSFRDVPETRPKFFVEITEEGIEQNVVMFVLVLNWCYRARFSVLFRIRLTSCNMSEFLSIIPPFSRRIYDKCIDEKVSRLSTLLSF